MYWDEYISRLIGNGTVVAAAAICGIKQGEESVWAKSSTGLDNITVSTHTHTHTHCDPHVSTVSHTPH